MDNIRKVYLHDWVWNPIGSFGEALNIHNADVHTVIIDKYIHQHTATVTTLTTTVVWDGTEYTIDVADSTWFLAWDYLHINTSSVETTHPIIISINNPTWPATFTLDRRLDLTHAIWDEVRKSLVNMAPQIWSLATPQEYFVWPQAWEVWHITRLLFSMTHPTAWDLWKFWNLTALTNWVVLRAKVNWQYWTLTNWKTNADIKSDMYDVDFDLRSWWGWDYWTSWRWTFTNAWAVVRLDWDNADKIELYVQDDISWLNFFTMKFQWHFENL